MTTGKPTRKLLQTSFFDGRIGNRRYNLPISHTISDILPVYKITVNFVVWEYINSLMDIKHDSGLKDLLIDILGE